MGTSLSAVRPSSGALLGALTQTTVILEIAILAIVVGLLITILVLYRRRNAPPKPREAPQAASNYYGDLATVQSPQTATGYGNQGDPFAGFGAGAAAPQGAPAPAPAPQAAPAPAPAPAPVAAPVAPQPVPAPAPAPAPMAVGPVPGTPAGWLPDPSGAPNTLRYWDGTTWTQHVAQRS
ncbi:MAG TPA: DUF2510 domain-containing protein [Acidimicrobiales bacterium]|nr:DUF2510 domain-containing protein [Acidimicrobiales bacterium]